jgi:arginyl-tRNA--protein-N-Asp/Glu arginylyltransferase
VRVLEHSISAAQACPYLEAEQATFETLVMVDVSPADVSQLLMRGWRRFGPSYFRPVCPRCDACESLRVNLESFEPSASQRRVLRRNADVRVSVGEPTVDEVRLALYREWHHNRESSRGWSPDQMDAQGYALHFAFAHPAAREFSYYLDNTLVGVGLSDETPDAISAAYFYFSPKFASRSLGTLNVLTQASWGRSRGRAHLYLGYRVEGCASLRYKGAFVPHERLTSRVSGIQTPRWEPPPPKDPEAGR